MKHLSIIFNDYKDLDNKENWSKIMEFVSSKNVQIMIYMSHFFANDKMCKDELDNTYFVKLADSFATQECEGQIATYWCYLTEKYVLKMTKFANE